MSVVRAESVSKRFGELTVLSDVSFDVPKGRVTVIIGRSGSGKSTMLRCINGLEEINGGNLEVLGHSLPLPPKALRALRVEVGMVFQSYNLFPHMTTEENVMIAPRIVKGAGRAEARQVAHRVLDQVGLGDKRDAMPEQLSGGQQQRVAIARSLAMQPQLMLFDEVTSALDPELTGEVLRVIGALAREGMTMVLVTHEMGFAKNVATEVLFMHNGRIWESGPPDTLFSSPRTPELQQFLNAGELRE
ncbi:MAG TPA: amino acid ABC transporter ATP-binding protein [Trueperaceae bacterium]|nr:amino acid ABC transporter ATP-binding protein [Trueperaceae bacterium]